MESSGSGSDITLDRDPWPGNPSRSTDRQGNLATWPPSSSEIQFGILLLAAGKPAESAALRALHSNRDLSFTRATSRPSGPICTRRLCKQPRARSTPGPDDGVAARVGVSFDGGMGPILHHRVRRVPPRPARAPDAHPRRLKRTARGAVDPPARVSLGHAARCGGPVLRALERTGVLSCRARTRASARRRRRRAARRLRARATRRPRGGSAARRRRRDAGGGRGRRGGRARDLELGAAVGAALRAARARRRRRRACASRARSRRRRARRRRGRGRRRRRARGAVAGAARTRIGHYRVRPVVSGRVARARRRRRGGPRGAPERRRGRARASCGGALATKTRCRRENKKDGRVHGLTHPPHTGAGGAQLESTVGLPAKSPGDACLEKVCVCTTFCVSSRSLSTLPKSRSPLSLPLYI